MKNIEEIFKKGRFSSRDRKKDFNNTRKQPQRKSKKSGKIYRSFNASLHNKFVKKISGRNLATNGIILKIS